MSAELFQILIIVLPIVLPPLIAFLVVLVNKELAKLPANVRPVLADVAKVSVSAVEQVAQSELGTAEKKQKALAFASAQLDHLGMKVPTDVLNVVVEDAVFAVKHAPPIVLATPAALPINTKGA